MRSIAKNSANRCVLGVLGALRKILERHAQIQRFPDLSDGKATAERHSPAFSLGLTCFLVIVFNF
jgi:hypothetical protein